LSFSSGYATALGAIGALLGRDDVIILDKLVHASIVDAAKLCGAKIRVFAHNDLDDLEEKLIWAKHAKTKTLVITESIFSMDGDAAPLREIVGLKNKYGAWLMVDEAHATGILGEKGRGLADELGISNQIEIQMGTLGKALGASGGYICGPRALIDLLVNRARSFIFSTAPPPAAAAAAIAAVQFIQSAEGENRRKHLRERLNQFHSALRTPHSASRSAIIPIILGDENEAVAAADELRKRKIFVPAIRFPAVARGAARLRVTLTAAHSAEDVAILAGALEKIVGRKP
ncbi:MAG TPA: aminotransferase class I/II-fold pyridoxal phosphate-dependent enzyme, partial [Verrucomicrobiae bacterium]|nr:aminotransferase class I/II-fold pyridoxal phosphate-dependent enzyme [Verrucomicrobiae bacterium]